MSIWQNIKDSVNNINDIVNVESVANLISELKKTTEENDKLKLKILELQSQLTGNNNLIKKNNYYEDSNGAKYCPICYEQEQNRVSLATSVVSSFEEIKCIKCGFNAITMI